MKAAARGLFLPSLWTSSWALLLLWMALAILPDAVSVFVSLTRQNLTSHSSSEVLRAGRVVDCTGSHSSSALQACIASHIGSATDKTWIILPVRWADTEKTAGVLDWTPLDTVMAMAEEQEWEPILSLQSVPLWLAGKALWDRDSPAAVSSFPAEFALFSGQVAQRFGDQVQFYQLGQFANGPVADFPFGVNPVRYGQMIRSAVPVLVAADPDAIILSAPLVPIPTPSPAAAPPESWLHRLEDTDATSKLDILLLRPGAVSPQAPIELHVHPFWPGQAEGLDRWLLVAAEPPRVWSIVSLFPRDNAHEAEDGPSWLWRHGTRSGNWGIYLVWLLLPLCVAAGWIRSVPPLAKVLQASWPQGTQEAGWWLVTVALLCTVYLVPSWLWAVGPIVLLSTMALARPTSLWLLTLAVLPLHQVHANFVSPLVNQAFSLAPAHILVFALTPALLYRQPLVLATATRGYRAWLLGGWFLLLFLGGLGVTHTGHFSQWTRIGFFPGWLALLTLGIGLNQENARSGLISLATGISLFGFLALIQWASGQNPAAVPLPRLSGLTFSPNHAAMLLERGLWLWLPLVWMAGNRWDRMGWLGLAVLTAVALLLTLSRGALTLGLLGGLLALGISLRRMPGPGPLGPGKWAAVAMAVIVVALGISIAFLRVALWERALDAMPVAARWQIWTHTWDMAKTHPWLGLGVDGFYHQAAASFPGSGSVSPDISHAHNVWLETLSRWGVAGWIWTVGLAVGLIWRRTGPTALQARLLMAGTAGALLAGLAHAQVDAFWYWPDVAAINLVLLLSLDTFMEATPEKAKRPAKQDAGGEEPPAPEIRWSAGRPQH